MDSARNIPIALTLASVTSAVVGVLLIAFASFMQWMAWGEPHGYVRAFFVIPGLSIGTALIGCAGLLRWRFSGWSLRVISAAFTAIGVGVFTYLVVALGHEMRAF